MDNYQYKLRKIWNNAHSLSAFFIVTGIIAIWGTTTQVTYDLLSYFRLLSFIIVVVISTSFVIFNYRAALKIVPGILMCALIPAYSIIQFKISSPAQEVNIGDYITFFFVNAAIITTLMFTNKSKMVFDGKSSLYFLIFAISVVSLTVLMGGLHFRPLPEFVYEIRMLDGRNISYSQGISKFYGLSAIVTALFISKAQNLVEKSALFLIFFIFIYLSFIGGGRGDFLAALGVSALALGAGRFAIIAITIFFVGGNYFLPVLSEFYPQLFGRYQILFDQSASIRLNLVDQSFYLLLNEPKCLIVGCGLNYFQYYFNLPPGMHPHNIYLEAIISFGLPITVISILFVLAGIFSHLKREGKNSAIIWIFLYFCLIGLKSGTLMTSWFVSAGALYFATYSIFENRKLQKLLGGQIGKGH